MHLIIQQQAIHTIFENSKNGHDGKRIPLPKKSLYYIAKKTKDDPVRSYSSQFSFASS